MTKLTDLDRQIIQQCILDRWNPHRLNRKIAHHFGLPLNQVRHIRRKPAFKQEYARQMAIYQGAFDEVQMADRKERVKAMDALFHKIPDYRVALKLKVLAAIRAEVAGDHVIHHTHLHHAVPTGPDIPPRPATYEEWLKQNLLGQQAGRVGQGEEAAGSG